MPLRVLGLIAAFVLLPPTVAAAQPTTPARSFVTHTAFFSLESKQANVLDPEAFVADPSASAATGPQGIAHVAGVRPAFGVDDPEARVLNAQGKPLGFVYHSDGIAHGSDRGQIGVNAHHQLIIRLQ